MQQDQTKNDMQNNAGNTAKQNTQNNTESGRCQSGKQMQSAKNLAHQHNVNGRHGRHNAHKDGLSATSESVYENLAQDAWFPAMYADEILIDEFED